jgi:hypothetical protein
MLDKKYTGHNAVLIEEKLEEIGARLERVLQIPDIISFAGTGFNDSNLEN